MEETAECCDSRRNVAPAELPDIPQPTRHDQERARLTAQVGQVYGDKGRAARAMKRFGKCKPLNP